jgi:hypothetical protein
MVLGFAKFSIRTDSRSAREHREASFIPGVERDGTVRPVVHPAARSS